MSPGINVLLRGERSDGRLAVMDNGVRAGFGGPPLHQHDFDEAFYVLEGELTFQLDEQVLTRTAGELAFAPRGRPHTFANRSGADASVLIVCTPAGFERYFDRIAAREAGTEPPPSALQPYQEVTKVGPQIGDRPLTITRPAAEPGDEPQRPGSLRPRVLLRSEQSGDEVAVIENVVPARWQGPPLHHHAFDEAFYVLDGELTFRLADELSTAGPGTFAYAPGGVHHTLANRGDAEARYLLVCTPGGFERYFDRIAAELAGVEPPPEALKPYPESTMVGPPIAEAGD